MDTKQKVRFSLGQLVATPGALDALQRNNTTSLDFLRRHARGDWGEVCAEDKQANARALIDGSRLLSAYTLADGSKLWIITDAVIDDQGNRQATTLLLPEEY